MIQGFLIKVLLAPFTLLYGIGVSIVDFFYRKGILKGVSFDIPIISVGNLTVGGAGKTPHIEYLVRLLKDYVELATLSRGYKRKTKGFLVADPQHNAEIVGDEPLQFKRKFPGIMVTVAENRTFAVPEILKLNPEIQVILLDDAFQHRSIDPGLNILLTEYDRPFTKDWLMPSGRLREWRSAYRRADVIIVSKCPLGLTEDQRKEMKGAINLYAHQRLYFSFYKYLTPYYIMAPEYKVPVQPDWDVLLICAIAGTEYLADHLEEQVNSVKVLSYEDHRYFSKFDLSHLQLTFDNMESERKVILTTEKDAMRLELHREFIVQHQLPLFVLPVEVVFHFDDGEHFDRDIRNFLLNFRS